MLLTTRPPCESLPQMSRGSRATLAGGIVLALALTAGIGAAPAKKKSGGTKPFEATKTVNAAVPDAVAATRSVPLISTITVPKKYKGKVVGDVNVTGIKTTGSAAGAAGQLSATLIAPNGRAVLLFRGQGDQNLGPWTLDDDTPVSVCNNPVGAPCANPNQSLARPFAGTSNLVYNDGPSLTPLQGLDGTPMKGTWTLNASDVTVGLTSTFNTWGLKITPAKPVSK